MNFKEYKEKINKESYPDDYFFLKYDWKTGKTYKDEEMYNIKKRFSDILHDELKYYKNIIGNKYYRQIIYLSKKDYEKVELHQVTNARHRIALTKLRLSNHKLAIETGRYSRPFKKPAERICPCNL